MTKNLIIIPARKGSKRIKNKNIVSVLNRPLILWTIDYAKKLSKKKFDIIVASDCNKIKQICLKNDIFFLKRPKKISSDHSTMHEVIFYVYNKINIKYNYIILLQPTSPLREPGLVDKAIKILDNNKKFDSLIHLANDPSFSGRVIKNHWIPEFNLNKRSQDINIKFVPTGNVFIYRSFLYDQKLKHPKKTYGLTSNNKKWVDIDEEEDLILLNYYLKRIHK